MDDKDAAAAMERHVPGSIWCSLVSFMTDMIRS